MDLMEDGQNREMINTITRHQIIKTKGRLLFLFSKTQIENSEIQIIRFDGFLFLKTVHLNGF